MNNFVANPTLATLAVINDSAEIVLAETESPNYANRETLIPTQSNKVRTWNEENYVKFLMTCIYVIIFTCGNVGNLVFCLVISMNKKLHNITNFYLLSMSCSDLLVLFFGMPYDFYSLWSTDAYFEKKYSIFHSLLLETSTSASILTITFFTIERYIAICHPFRRRANHTRTGRALKNIVCIWIISIILTIPVIIYHPSLNEGKRHDNESATFIFMILSFIFLFAIPLILIAVLYMFIIIELKSSERLTETHPTMKEPMPKANFMVSREMIARYKDVIKILVAVVVSFFLCFSPLQCQRLLSVFGNQHQEYVFNSFRILTHVSGVCHYLSTCMNPILYSIMSKRFRIAMRKTFSQCSKRRRRTFHMSTTQRHQRTFESRLSSYQASHSARIPNFSWTKDLPSTTIQRTAEIKRDNNLSNGFLKSLWGLLGWSQSLKDPQGSTEDAVCNHTPHTIKANPRVNATESSENVNSSRTESLSNHTSQGTSESVKSSIVSISDSSIVQIENDTVSKGCIRADVLIHAHDST